MGGARTAMIAVALLVLALVPLRPAPSSVLEDTSQPGFDGLRSGLPLRYIIEVATGAGEMEERFAVSDGGATYGFAQSAVFVRPRPTGLADGSGPLVRIRFGGSSPTWPVGVSELAHRTHVFLGHDPGGWRTDLRGFREVRYEGLYDGVDLTYRIGAKGGVKYEFRLLSGSDPTQIRMDYEGVEEVRIDHAGNLLVTSPLGTFRDDAPVAFQNSMIVHCGFRMAAARTVGFHCQDWDPSLPLLIDPLLYATFLGASGRDEARGIAVDAAGSAYVTGMTGSLDFPATPGALSVSSHGAFDVFVAKLSPNGTGLEYATFIGGGNEDEGYAVAVDATGRAYVTGYTLSPDFPSTAGAFDTSFQGGDAFVLRLSPRGDSLEYATLLGGTSFDEGLSVALDTEGSAYVAGETLSSDFPTTAGAFDRAGNGGWDGFVVSLDPTGGALRYGTYLGGLFFDAVHGVTVDALGEAVVTGYTRSTDFPATPGAFQTLLAGDFDAFVTKLAPDGAALVYSTFVGGKSLDQAADIALDPQGGVHVAGGTFSTAFPVTPDGLDTTSNGHADAFYFHLSPLGDRLLYSTYFGGSGFDEVRGLAIDPSGGAVLAGVTDSPDLPLLPRGVGMSNGDLRDGFLAWLAGGGLGYSAHFGGSSVDDFYGVAVDARGTAYVAGATGSSEFPTTAGAFDPTFNGDRDAIVFRTTLEHSPPSLDAVIGLLLAVTVGVIVALAVLWKMRRRRALPPTPPPV